ncbi:MAG: thioredoxin family protein [Gammaproteobacteria bacterium]|nr:thioredoxin family protein [Gammaproteobacteria bacterium]
MVAVDTPLGEIGMQAPSFSLRNVDNSTQSFSELQGKNGTVVVFMCNHCPFVKAVLDELITASTALQEQGVNMIAINSNDTEQYPDDSFENMQQLAKEKAFPFSYLIDETQQVAKDYGAVCTPDFFGFDKDGLLKYRGRLSETRPNAPAPDGAPCDLLDAMVQIKENGEAPAEQLPSMGCSIKWRA